MTDVPRRSYPLVVAPPGGFENAVKQGRRLRRRRTGGTAGAALALVGALTYSTLGHESGTNSLEPTNPMPTAGQTHAPGTSPTPSPEASATPTATAAPATGEPAASPRPGTGSRPTDVPAAPPPGPVETTRPPRDDDNPKVYAARNPIDEGPATTMAGTECEALGAAWCAYVRVTTPSQGAASGTYELVFGLCRRLQSGDGRIEFDRVQEVDFSATDTRGDDDPANDDTVWTYSAGQPVVPARSQTDVPAGNCVEWSTTWDGYDDFGYNPPGGTYILRARSTGRSDVTLPTKSVTFDHE